MTPLINTPRYPTSQAPEPMVAVARSIIAACIPIHRRTTSSSSTTTSTLSSSSSSSDDDKSPLLLEAAKKTVKASYGTLNLPARRQEAKRQQIKMSISRPISHEVEWWAEAETHHANQIVQESKEEDGEGSVGSVYSTQTWSSEVEGQRAFEYDDSKGKRDSTLSMFGSHDRCYTYF